MNASYIVDGYNLLHKLEAEKRRKSIDLADARNTVIERVALFCHATSARVCLVFDGRGTKTEPLPEPPRASTLEVLFSPGSTSADAVIERMVYQAQNRRDLVVVTGDRTMRDLCYRMGALVMDAPNFLQVMNDAATTVRTMAADVSRDTSPVRLQERIDEKGLSQLLRLRQQLENTSGKS